MTGLLDWLAARCRCEISDLPRKPGTVGWLAQETDETYPLAEWTQAAAYLFPQAPPPFADEGEAKAYFAEQGKRLRRSAGDGWNDGT